MNDKLYLHIYVSGNYADVMNSNRKLLDTIKFDINLCALRNRPCVNRSCVNFMEWRMETLYQVNNLISQRVKELFDLGKCMTTEYQIQYH
jgi:hypothetical protein